MATIQTTCVGLLLTLTISVAAPAFAGDPEMAPAPAPATAAADTAPAATPLPPLGISDVKLGKGAEAQNGHVVRVHYTGWLFDPKGKNKHGKQFDSSRTRGRTPLEFELGSGRVIKGWDLGVAGMKVGGKRTLTIPSELAYGARGAGNGIIPPDASLVFDVELLGVK
jgi:FKBP-type peptidyl-prolyl cis-trans isomerase FkpA